MSMVAVFLGKTEKYGSSVEVRAAPNIYDDTFLHFDIYICSQM
jgi:hypothetical protein